MFNTKRKGITPVIAIVLLLLVTVGAVGVVYTQFQELVEDPDTDFLDEVETQIQSATRAEDTVNTDNDGVEIRIQNSGDQEYNLTESIRMEYTFNGDGPVEFATVEDISDLETDDDQDDFCMEGVSDELFTPGETRSCHTGVEMPGPTDELEIHLIQAADGEEIDSWECSPSTSDSATC